MSVSMSDTDFLLLALTTVKGERFTSFSLNALSMTDLNWVGTQFRKLLVDLIPAYV